MEQEAAEVMWGRSVQILEFRSVHVLSDGDSTACKAVCDLNPSNPQLVSELGCVNHAHKRMGTALRKLAEENGLGGRGIGRLTEWKHDSLRNFHRGAVLDNIPNVEKMRNAV